ncbi:MAG: hypothetical protein HWN68_01680 [Desulfobacterales bacterium]|nr:hypothetical protein [Desulfobacterales bacterium]
MIINIAIILTILASLVYVVLIIRVGAAGKKKNALINLEKLYQLYHNQSPKQGATIHQPNQSSEKSVPKE